MAFSPNEFLANATAHGGFAKTNRFQVILPIPEGVSKFVSKTGFLAALDAISDATQALTNSLFSTGQQTSSLSRFLALQCETAEIPGRNLATDPVEIYGPPHKLPYANLYDDIGLTFLCTNEFYERKLFEAWMNAIVPVDTYNIRYKKAPGGQRNYSTDIVIIQYDEFIKQIYAVKLIDAFPITLSPMVMNWQDDGFHRLQVRFAYTKYEEVTSLMYEIPDVTSILGSVANRVLSATTFRF